MQGISQTIKGLPRCEGNTLIEMLVIVGIIGVITGAALPHFDTRRQDVHSVMRHLVGEFRTARTQALTTGTHYALHAPSADRLNVQRLQQAIDGSWQLATVTQRIALPSHLTLSMVPDKIEFNTRGTMITAPEPLYVYLSDRYGTKVHSFSVWPSGQVREEF